MRSIKFILLIMLILLAGALGYYLNEPAPEQIGTNQTASIGKQSIKLKGGDAQKDARSSKNSSDGNLTLGKLNPGNSSFNKKNPALGKSGREANNRTVKQRLEECKSRENILKTISCYKKILAKNPEHAPANYLLAAACMQNANFEKADKHFALFWKYATEKQRKEYNIHQYTDLKSINQTLARLESNTEKADKKDFRIPYKNINKHIVVEVLLNRTQEANMIFDTGASITVISPSLAGKLELSNKGSIILHTIAEKELRAGLYSLDSLVLGPMANKDLPVATAEIRAIQSATIDGILGMDFLKNYSFRINQSKQEIIFKTHQ